ncbi:MAG: DUF4129 domain-containing protein [Bacillota bacterium]
MNWHRSLFIKLSSSILSLACHASVYAPWFVLIGAYFRMPGIMSLYWQLVFALGCAFLLSRTCGPLLQRIHQRCRRAAASAAGGIGILFTSAFIVLPVLRSGSPLASYWPWLFVAGMASWLRGVDLGSAPLDSLVMQRHLVVGAAATALSLLLIGRLIQPELVLAQALPFVLFWLIAATVATALIRLAELAGKDEGESPELARFWPPLLAGVAFVCLITALLLSAAAPVIVHFLRQPARLLLRALEFSLMLVAYALGFIVQCGIWLVKLFVRRAEGAEPAYSEAPDPSEFFQGQELKQLPPAAAEVAKWAIVLAVTLLVAIMAANYLLRIWWKGKRDNPDETRESYASLGALAVWTKARVAGLIRSLGSASARFSRTYGRRVPKTVTQVYHLLLQAAAGKGINRPAPVTPHRFQPQLAGGFPEHRQSLDRILDAFAFEYYGEEQLSPEEMDAILREWGRISHKD